MPIQEKIGLIKTLIHKTNEIKKTIKGQHLEIRIYFNYFILDGFGLR